MNKIDVFCSKLSLLGEIVVRASNNRALTTTKNGVISLYDSLTGSRIERYNSIKIIGNYFECHTEDESHLLNDKLSIIDKIKASRIKSVIADRYLIVVSDTGNRMSVKLIGSRYIIDGPLNNCKAYKVKCENTIDTVFVCSWPNGEITIEICNKADNKCRRVADVQPKSRVIIGYSQYCITDEHNKYRIYDYSGKLKLSLLKPGIEVRHTLIENKDYIVVTSFKNEIYRFLAAHNYN